MNVVEPIIPRYIWEECQAQKIINQRTYTRDRVYTFFQKIKCPTCGRIMKCKGAGGKKKKYMYYNCKNCNFNIREFYIEEAFKNILAELITFDNDYNELFLPLFAEKTLLVEKKIIEKEIIKLTLQKERIESLIKDIEETSNYLDNYKNVIDSLTSINDNLEYQKNKNNELIRKNNKLQEDKKSLKEDILDKKESIEFLKQVINVKEDKYLELITYMAQNVNSLDNYKSSIYQRIANDLKNKGIIKNN